MPTQGPPPMRPDWNRPPMQQGFPPQGPPQLQPNMGPRGPPPLGPPGGPPQGPPSGPAPHVNPAFFQQGGGPPPPIQHMAGPGPGIVIFYVLWLVCQLGIDWRLLLNPKWVYNSCPG